MINGEAARVKDAGGDVAVGAGSGVYDVAVSVRPIYFAGVNAGKASDAPSCGGLACKLDFNVRNARDYCPKAVGTDKSAEVAAALCGIGCNLAGDVAADYRREVSSRKYAAAAASYFRSHQIYVLDHRFIVDGIIAWNANIAKQPVRSL